MTRVRFAKRRGSVGEAIGMAFHRATVLARQPAQPSPDLGLDLKTASGYSPDEAEATPIGQETPVPTGV
ncbi:hypothetical protein ACFXBB_14180 [Streptomyces scopuliridis]|uniref:hypothetical protein n=1 Tax=Streptomyces scopuliridis TaxID=452529 RepID=UPI0036BA3E1B